MVESEPRIVRFTDHALAKAELLGIARTDVELAVLKRHRERKRNTRAADWLIVARATRDRLAPSRWRR
jgi:hypothetical protein